MVEEEIGLRDLRQRASEVVRIVEAGAALTITVSGRAAARIVPVQTRQWRTWTAVQDVLAGAGAPSLAEDLAGVEDTVSDPFEHDGGGGVGA
jgi:prevent-host-death family protein